MSDKFLDTDETVRLLNISRPTLYKWMKQGILKPVDMYPSNFKRRPKLLFRENEVRALMPAEPPVEESSSSEEASRNKDKAA